MTVKFPNHLGCAGDVPSAISSGAPVIATYSPSSFFLIEVVHKNELGGSNSCVTVKIPTALGCAGDVPLAESFGAPVIAT